MTAGELFGIFRQNNIPNDAILMSDSGWECFATDMDGVYYNKLENTVVFTQEISKYDRYYGSDGWVVCKKGGAMIDEKGE